MRGNKLYEDVVKAPLDQNTENRRLENAGRAEIISVAVCTMAFFVECSCWPQFCKIGWGACAGVVGMVGGWAGLGGWVGGAGKGKCDTIHCRTKAGTMTVFVSAWY